MKLPNMPPPRGPRLWGLLLCSVVAGLHMHAAAAPLAVPFYTAEQALQGLYRHHLPPLARAFTTEARLLQDTTTVHCSGATPLANWRAQWLRTLAAWQHLNTPALGPLVTRRSQRRIDFWPTRPPLLQQAVQKAPQTVAELERIGSPAKGLAAIDTLLTTAETTSASPFPAGHPAACHYAALLAQDILLEAQALQTDLEALNTQDWYASTDATRAAFAEWINQWLGALERLRWQHMEKPLEAHRTERRDATPVFPRHTQAGNLTDWQAQWHSLYAQARWTPPGVSTPPPPGQSLIPIEALLMGQGQLALAQRWAQALDKAHGLLTQLPPPAGKQELRPVLQALKALAVLYQNEVAPALNVPLGFSDADGD